MRLTNRLSMLGCIAATLTMIAGSASAQIAVYSEPGDEDCGEVVNDDGAVSGGCHVEARSNRVTMYVYVPSQVPISSCMVELEGFVGEDGTGYITSAFLSPPSGGPPVPCTRVPCNLPWPAQIGEPGPSDELVEVTFCITPSGGGGPGSTCTLHIDPFNDSEHDWQVGGSEYFCENAPSVSFGGTFSAVPSGEVAEVVHEEPQ